MKFNSPLIKINIDWCFYADSEAPENAWNPTHDDVKFAITFISKI